MEADDLYRHYVLKTMKALAPKLESIEEVRKARIDYWSHYRGRASRPQLLKSAYDRYQIALQKVRSETNSRHFKDLEETSGLSAGVLSRALRKLEPLGLIHKHMSKYELTTTGIDLGAIVISNEDLWNTDKSQKIKAISTESKRHVLSFLAVVKHGKLAEIAEGSLVGRSSASKILKQFSSCGLVTKSDYEFLIEVTGLQMHGFAKEIESCVSESDRGSLPIDLTRSIRRGDNRTLEASIHIRGCQPQKRTSFLRGVITTLLDLGFIHYKSDMITNYFVLVTEPLATVIALSTIDDSESLIGIDMEGVFPMDPDYVTTRLGTDLGEKAAEELTLTFGPKLSRTALNYYARAMLVANAKVVMKRLRQEVKKKSSREGFQVEEYFNGIFFQAGVPPLLVTDIPELRYFGGITSL